MYFKTLNQISNLCGIKFSQFNENDILVHFNFGIHDIPWLQIAEKINLGDITMYSFMGRIPIIFSFLSEPRQICTHVSEIKLKYWRTEVLALLAFTANIAKI